jgi:hypothetical protein
LIASIEEPARSSTRTALAPLFDELADKSAREIARIPSRRVATPTGKPWSAMTVIRAHDRLAASA